MATAGKHRRATPPRGEIGHRPWLRQTIASTRIGIDRVLIATDFSHQSELALQYGLDFARLFGAQAEIAYVLPTEEYALAGAEGLLAGRDAARRDLLALEVEAYAVSVAYNDDTECQVTMLEGPVADSLLECGPGRRGPTLSLSEPMGAAAWAS